MIPYGGIKIQRDRHSLYMGRLSWGLHFEGDISFSKEKKLTVLNEAGMSHNVNWREELWIGF